MCIIESFIKKETVNGALFFLPCSFSSGACAGLARAVPTTLYSCTRTGTDLGCARTGTRTATDEEGGACAEKGGECYALCATDKCQ